MNSLITVISPKSARLLSFSLPVVMMTQEQTRLLASMAVSPYATVVVEQHQMTTGIETKWEN